LAVKSDVIPTRFETGVMSAEPTYSGYAVFTIIGALAC
jgi:hypothetical protein